MSSRAQAREVPDRRWRHARGLRSLPLFVGLCVAAGLLALAAAPAAHALTVTGTIYDDGGHGYPGRIMAYDSRGTSLGGITAKADGTYTYTLWGSGTCSLAFWDPAGNFAFQWYGGSDFASATSIQYSSSTNLTINVELVGTSHIIGLVKDPAGNPLPNIAIRAYQSDGLGGWIDISDAKTSDIGYFNLAGIGAGSYRVRFYDASGTYLTQYYNGASTLAAATDVAVATYGNTTGVDATLALAGHITGKVTNADRVGLVGLGGGAFRSDGKGGWTLVKPITTTSGGAYQVDGLATGDYRLEFDDSSGDYLTQCYGNASSLALGTDVAVTAGATTSGVDVVMPAAGHISGVVTDAGHVGLPTMEVTACQPDGSGGWAIVGYAITASDGTYTIGGLTAGGYRLKIIDDAGTGYGTQYFDDESGFDSADAVAVTQGHTTAGINATLAIPASDTTPPTTVASGTDALWHASPVVVTLSAADDQGGVGLFETEYRLQGSAVWLPYAPPLSIATEGASTYQFRSIDLAQNAELAKTFAVKIDTTAPITVARGADGAWHRTPVKLTFTSSDTAGSGTIGGLARTEYKVDSGAWTGGTSVTVAAPANHANDGVRSVSYRSCDAVGNQETANVLTVLIDTTGPTTAAKAAHGRKGKAIALRYAVRDARSPQATAVTVTVRNSHGKVVKTFRLGTRKTAVWYAASWKPRVAGVYRFAVTAKDLAGNAQAKAGVARVTVK